MANLDGEYIEEIDHLQSQVDKSEMPDLLRDKINLMLKRLRRLAQSGVFGQEYDSTAKYVDWIVNLPWKNRCEDILDLNYAKEVLDRSHYGLEELKDRILEYISVMQLKFVQLQKEENKSKEEAISELMRAPILFFVGLVGTGKTTIAKSIAEAMGRPFVRIPFGGMGDALILRGQSRIRPDAEVGYVLKALRRAEVKNPVVLLDEIDRVGEEARSDIMGVLVELLDPGQNNAFTDHYIDFPFDLSQCLFIATANNTQNIATAVLDRMELIRMPSYSDDEKIHIAKDYVLPKVLRDSGLTKSQLVIEDDAWPLIVRPLGFDSGIRTLERTINGIARKTARQIVEGKADSLIISASNAKPYLPTW